MSSGFLYLTLSRILVQRLSRYRKVWIFGHVVRLASQFHFSLGFSDELCSAISEL